MSDKPTQTKGGAGEMTEMEELGKNLAGIKRNTKIIKIEVMVFLYLVSFLIGVLTGKLLFR